MDSLVRFLFASLVCLLQLLNHVSATIDITYPIAGTNYTSMPYQIQWTSGSGDPSNITIYLATYNSSNAIINELRSLTWDTSSGSTYITMTEAPPKGNSWTWMFYDTSKPLNLNQNEIAASAHFFFPESLLPTVPGTTPSPHHTISAGAAGVVGAVVALAVVAVCFWAFFCYRKRQRIAKDNIIDPGAESSHFKPELESRDYGIVESRTQPLVNQETQASTMPLPVLRDRSELSAPARHELYDNTQGYNNSQMPTPTNTSQIPRSELQTHSVHIATSPTIKRKEVGGTWQ